eukprot:1089847-Heterocapsa_arctica.AAC.1
MSEGSSARQEVEDAASQHRVVLHQVDVGDAYVALDRTRGMHADDAALDVVRHREPGRFFIALERQLPFAQLVGEIHQLTSPARLHNSNEHSHIPCWLTRLVLDQDASVHFEPVRVGDELEDAPRTPDGEAAVQHRVEQLAEVLLVGRAAFNDDLLLDALNRVE